MLKKMFLFVALAVILLPVQAKAEVAQGKSSKNISQLFEDLFIKEFKEKPEAPPFTLPDLEGKKVSLKDYRGKLIFLNFWTAGCIDCREEMPSMEKLYQKFKEEGFTILAVNIGESLKLITPFLQESNLTFPILLDSTKQVSNAYKENKGPITYLIDRQGRKIGKIIGPRDWASEKAFALIEALIAE